MSRATIPFLSPILLGLVLVVMAPRSAERADAAGASLEPPAASSDETGKPGIGPMPVLELRNPAVASAWPSPVRAPVSTFAPITAAPAFPPVKGVTASPAAPPVAPAGPAAVLPSAGQPLP